MKYTILAISVSLFISVLFFLIKRIGRDEVIGEITSNDDKVAEAIKKMAAKERSVYDKEIRNVIDRQFNYVSLPVKKNRSDPKDGIRSSKRVRKSNRKKNRS